jgi:putative lumazine-binding protein
MRYPILIALTLAAMIRPAAAQTPARDSVRRAALDYLEGFYEGDSAKIVRSVRPDVRKVGYYTEQGSPKYLGEEMPFAEMITYTNNFRKRGRTTPATAPREVIVGEVNDQTATAKVVAWWGIDYLQLAKYDGKWMIVNVMWQSPPK